MRIVAAAGIALMIAVTSLAAAGASDEVSAAREQRFRQQIVPILERRCVSCHNSRDRKGGLSLQNASDAVRGGDSGAVIVPGDPDSSYLIDLITSADGDAEMPRDADPLPVGDVTAVRQWIADGAVWPADVTIAEAAVADTNWWSLQPLTLPALPQLSEADAARVRTPIDAFILAKLRTAGLAPSPEADRRTLIRRLYFDLIGLPPTPEEVDAFVNDPDPQAYEQLVDRLLASPRYGERWARHWLDVVHYGDTHGYDKDKPRPNAWPYRDYVIRVFNDDLPYAQFVRAQVAGDVLEPRDPDGIVATGFIAAGPWDFISHAEVGEDKIDGQIARSLDRDDMVRNTLETFCSVTVGCARCHNHKFDPITQADYYGLQAVFAAVDRADRPYDAQPEAVRQRQELVALQAELEGRKRALDAEVRRLGGAELQEIETQLAAQQRSSQSAERPEFGYHSQIAPRPDVTKWVQVDLGQRTEIARVTIVGCHDDFNHIGAGFGFPVRYRIDASNDPEFGATVTTIVDRSRSDAPNPGVAPLTEDLSSRRPPVSARYVRVTATQLALRQNDYIFALAELQVFTPDGRNAAAAQAVTALDSIEAPVRWRKSNLVDGYYYGLAGDPAIADQRARLADQRATLLARVLPPGKQQEIEQTAADLNSTEQRLAALPPPPMVYAAATSFAAVGNHKPTGGQPREIRILHRGNILMPGDVASPGALVCVASLPGRFELPAGHTEGQRRRALADWLAHRDNPLTWRSIVNRVWQYHFGRGLVETPNDFGRMGQLPTHPELLDWLAAQFRDQGQSFKRLHRLICNSATYRQASAAASIGVARVDTAMDSSAAQERSRPALLIDADNRFLWRMNRRRLEAEAVRDAVLKVAGQLDVTMFGPGFQDFVIEKPEHSPHYEYDLFDPEDPRSHRRSVYRFIVRSQQQPFMTTLDCADPSMQVDRRNETVTPQQALALLNNRLMVAMSRHFAARLESAAATRAEQLRLAYRLALSRDPRDAELQSLIPYANDYGLANACRVIFNLNEFVFVD